MNCQRKPGRGSVQRWYTTPERRAPGAVFVCMAGTRVDSHRFVPDVLKAGVRVLVTERGIEEELGCLRT